MLMNTANDRGTKIPSDDTKCSVGTCKRPWQTLVVNDEGKHVPCCNEHGTHIIESRKKKPVMARAI